LEKTGLDYEIMTAVDGRGVDLDDPTLIDPSLTYMTQFLPSTAGAALSHLNAYKKIIADGLDKALVLEDDVTLPADLGSLADAVADQLTGAEVALLSYGSWGSCKLSSEGSVHLPSSRLLALPIEIRLVNSGGAYIITQEACERMIKCVLPVRVNPDDWWYFYREGALDRVRCVMPLPVLKTPKLVSTVGSYTLGNSAKGRIAGPLVRHKIPLLHQVLTYRRQRIFRQWSRQELVDTRFIEKPSRLEQVDARGTD
jgi:GR25 family glycosyltransferase involved in LPS biosynthesis